MKNPQSQGRQGNSQLDLTLNALESGLTNAAALAGPNIAGWIKTLRGTPQFSSICEELQTLHDVLDGGTSNTTALASSLSTLGAQTIQAAAKATPDAQDKLRQLGQALSSAARRVFDFPNLASLISVRGFLVTFITLSLAAGLFRGLAWLARRILRSIRGARQDESSQMAGVIFYRRLTLLLAEFGLERPPGETHREFAERATVFLAGRGSSTEPVADVPSTVVEAFYRVRFGHREITPTALQMLERSLDALEASLRAQHA